MIKKAEDLRKNDEVHLKGGKGTINIINFLEKEESYGVGRLFGVSIIPKGCSIGYHKHEGDFEVYYFLEGSAKVCDNGVEDILGPGDCMVCREGDSHSIENNGNEDLKYIALILYAKDNEKVENFVS